MERNLSVRFAPSRPVEHHVASNNPSDEDLQKILSMSKPGYFDEDQYKYIDPYTAASLDVS